MLQRPCRSEGVFGTLAPRCERCYLFLCLHSPEALAFLRRAPMQRRTTGASRQAPTRSHLPSTSCRLSPGVKRLLLFHAVLVLVFAAPRSATASQHLSVE